MNERNCPLPCMIQERKHFVFVPEAQNITFPLDVFIPLNLFFSDAFCTVWVKRKLIEQLLIVSVRPPVGTAGRIKDKYSECYMPLGATEFYINKTCLLKEQTNNASSNHNNKNV
jgi:hypothetical protein